jgi:8-oxo-dGTP diphosphatase
MTSVVQNTFGNQIRVRVCGICLEAERILLINQSGLREGNFWSLPGGGLQVGESAEACLKREFLEETGLIVEISDFLFVCEFIKNPLHAIEVYFRVYPKRGTLAKGIDPELGDNQIIEAVRYFDEVEIQQLNANELHGIFEKAKDPFKIVDLRGYFKL